MARVRVLLVGLDPDIVDKPPVPELTAAKVRAAVEAESAKLELGYSVKSLLVDDGKTAEAVLTDALTTSRYDCIMIGAGLRVVPPYLLLFEKLINVVHRHAPASTTLCFNSNPSDTAEACGALGLDHCVADITQMLLTPSASTPYCPIPPSVAPRQRFLRKVQYRETSYETLRSVFQHLHGSDARLAGICR